MHKCVRLVSSINSVVVTRKMGLKIMSVLASGKRRIQARCKDLLKVTVQFVRRRICFQQTKSRFSLE
jgi:hypothetical protein